MGLMTFPAEARPIKIQVKSKGYAGIRAFHFTAINKPQMY